MKHKAPLLILLLFSCLASYGQYSLEGVVSSDGMALEYATVVINENKVMMTDSSGYFKFDNLFKGEYNLSITYIGYQSLKTKVDIPSQRQLSFELKEEVNLFDPVVVTGTKTFKRKTRTAVIVNVVDGKTLENVQACNLSEGLKFQPGLRVETDCQTCNYTQLRMNGLAGGYSQILVNGRPIFSPLTGLYGMEQLPANMIERIEVIRGGGSSLYGSSAIGGTVNVLTRIPKSNQLSVNSSFQSINGKSSDFMTNLNGSLVDKKGNGGVSLFFNNRNRQAYDHNDDNFSELPEIKNTSVGMSGFLQPGSNQKIEMSLSYINEERYGGEMVEGLSHLAQQAEDRTHHVWMGSLDYQINFNEDQSSFISYFAIQNTNRDHYTGILPDESEEDALQNHLDNPPYGTSTTTTIQGGFQLNHKVQNFLTGANIFTLGTEYTEDVTFDEIQAYNYLVDQTTKNLGLFMQSDWEIAPSLNVLSGIRIDEHNLVDKIIASPRVSLLYRSGSYTQFRLGYGAGFRAPQAFDTDLHIAFAGGGVSRVQLSESLREERSHSYNASINYDKPTENWVAGFTLEGFYTRLLDAFNLMPVGEDNFGEVFEKSNGSGAVVRGGSLELRANYMKKIQLETSLTLQESIFDDKVEYIEGVEGIREFIRTPNVYGSANISFMPNQRFNSNLNIVYTGSMKVPHFAGAPNQTIDEIVSTNSFVDVGFKVGYLVPVRKNLDVELYGGFKNIFNSYQNDFDIGKNRDSNFVYGPAQPRSVFLGMKLAI